MSYLESEVLLNRSLLWLLLAHATESKVLAALFIANAVLCFLRSIVKVVS